MSEIQQELVVEKKEVPAKKPELVKFSGSGIVDFKNHEELASAARLLVSVNLAPQHLQKDGVKAVMSALTLCKQYRLPYSAMNEMAYIEGKIGFYGNLMMAVAQRDPNFGDFKVLYVSKTQEEICLRNKNLSDDVWACVIQVKKKGADNWNEYFFTSDEAQSAGLLHKANYKKYLKDMLFHKAKNRALKTEYAAALGNVDGAEELIYERDSRAVGPADELNKKLGLSKEIEEESWTTEN